MDTTNETLLRLVRAGDEGAWQIFYDTYAPVIRRYSQLRGLSLNDADDIVQTVLLQFSKSNFKYDRTKGRFRGYLKKTVDWHAWRHFSQSAREPQFALQDHADGQSDHGQSDEFWHAAIMNAALERVRAQVNERHWNVFVKSWLDSLPVSEIAESEAESQQWVAKIKFRVLKKLEQEVEFLASESLFFE